VLVACGLNWIRFSLAKGREAGVLYCRGVVLFLTPRIDNCDPWAVLAQKFWGGGIAPSAPSSPSPFSPFSETEKYELHIGLHLKSIISRVANSVMG